MFVSGYYKNGCGKETDALITMDQYGHEWVWWPLKNIIE